MTIHMELRMPLISRLSLRFPAPLWYANMRKRGRPAGLGQGHDATTEQNLRVVAFVAAKAQSFQCLKACHDATTRKTGFPRVYAYMRAHARPCTRKHQYLCRGVVDRYNYLISLPKSHDKSHDAQILLCRGVVAGACWRWREFAKSLQSLDMVGF